VLAEPETARRIALFNDYVQVAPVAPGVALAEWAFARLGRLEARARALIDANAASFDRWIAGRTDLRAVPVAGGALRLLETPAIADTLAFTRRLHETRDTLVVPGDFFDLRGWLRLGLGGDPALFAEGLRRFGEALDEKAY
jgi:aspartate/methionine/tyrosine aminotransferase